MSADGGYDADELRALAVALDVLDPEDPEEWEGDPDAFASSVRRGRERLERRGVATFSRDGGAEVDPADAPMLHAFLAPDAVIEAWVVDGKQALQREWYVGAEVTVVADPSASEEDEQALSTIDTREVFTDVFGFLDMRGVDVDGDPVRLTSDELDGFCGRGRCDPHDPAPRLMNVAVGWERAPVPRELQILDAGEGGHWIVSTVESDTPTLGDVPESTPDVVDLIPATRGELVELLFAALNPGPVT